MDAEVSDENFCLKSENKNQHDKIAVAILLEEQIVGYVPKSLSKIFHQFIKIPKCAIGCKVTGKRVSWEQVMVLRFLSSTDLLVPKKQLKGQKRT